MKTIVALYDEVRNAEKAVNALVHAGYAREDISFVAADPAGSYATELEARDVQGGTHAAEGAAAGAVTGGVIGALGGVLVSLGAFMIPGVGPIIAAGPLVAAITGAGAGALAGGLIGALIGWGIPEEHAHYYAEGLRRGGSLVAVRAPEERVEQAVDILDDHNPINIERRASYWRTEGWTDFEPEREPYTEEQRAAARERYRTYDEDEFYEHAPAFYEHYRESLSQESHAYEDYETGYRYGYTLATDPRYREYESWDELEPVARRGWSEAHTEPWEDFSQTVRHGWREVRGALDPTAYSSDSIQRTTLGDDDFEKAFDRHEDEFRRHYRTTYPASGREYAWYEQGYRLGCRLATEPEYRSYERWPELEPHAREAWHEEHEDAWDEIRDTVRHAWREVKDNATGAAGSEATIDENAPSRGATGRALEPDEDFKRFDLYFRTHYDAHFAETGQDYATYLEAYRYGYDLARDEQNRGRSWDDIAGGAQQGWNAENRGTWYEFEEAVRYGWQRTRQAL